MGLEEETNEDLEIRCQQCGTLLTEAEMADVLESDGPNLCAVCAAEADTAEQD